MAAAKMVLMMCSVCLEEFKDPRALPCLHTFCLECLVGLCASNQNNGTVKCPMCKEQHRVPQNGAQGFRKNFMIKNFMEVNKTEEVHVKTTMCKQHPHLELTHYCEELNCSQALCIRCVTQEHQNHQIQPTKSICEAKLSHLKVMDEAIELDLQLVQSTREKLENNKSEMHDILRQRVNEFHARIDDEAKNNANYIDKMISEVHDVLAAKANEIEAAKAQQKLLEVGFSDTISNVVESNADKHLDEDLGSLHEKLNNWRIKYSLLKVIDLDPFKSMDKKWIATVPEQCIKGVPVSLLGPVVEPTVGSPRKIGKPTASTSRKRKAIVMTSDSNSDSHSESDSYSVSECSVTRSDFSSDSDDNYVPPTRRRKR